MPFKSRAQKEYLRINEPEIYERWMRDYDAESNQSFTPPATAVAAAKKGLSQRKKWGRGGLSPADAKSQGIDSGVTRARKISSGKVSRHDVRRMSAFNRHRQNNNPSKKMPDGGPTAGTIAWNLWGGTSGVNWAKKKSAAMNAETFEAHACDCSNSYRYRFDRDLTAVECDRCGGYLPWYDADPEAYEVFDSETFESPVSCKICGKTFDSFRGLNGHMNAHLPYRAEDEGIIMEESLSNCDSCGVELFMDEPKRNFGEECGKILSNNGVSYCACPDENEECECEEADDDVICTYNMCKPCWQRDLGKPCPKCGFSLLSSVLLRLYRVDTMQRHKRGAENFGDVDSDGQLAQALARARAKSQEPHRPLKITKLPHRDQTSLKDFEAESNTPLFTKESKVFAIGLASGIVATIFGNLLSEFVIDRYREDPELSDTEQNA